MKEGRHSLILHIGTHKTGNTALQIFLMKNAKQLRKYGLLYPDLAKIWQKTRGGEASSYINGKLLRASVTDNWTERDKDNLWKILRHYLQDYDVILSDPAIWSQRGINTVSLIDDFRKRYDNIKLIVYFRRQDLFIESIWNEFVKEGHMTASLEEYIKNSQDILDYNKKLSAIAKIVGKENIFVRIYEKEQFQGERGDITSDFLTAIRHIRGNIPETWKGIKMPGMVNPRLDGDMLMVRLYFNQAYGTEAEYQNQDIANHFINANYAAEKKYGYINPEMRKEIMEKYQESNCQLAVRFLNREDGILFFDNNYQYPLYHNNLTDREKYIIDVLGRISAEQNMKLRKTEDWRYELKQGVRVSEKIVNRIAHKLISPLTFHKYTDKGN